MADDDVDSLDDGQRWTGTAAGETPEESFPASGVVKPVVYAEVKTLPLPELRQHLRARGKNPAGGKANLVDRLQRALVERGESFPLDVALDNTLNEPQRRSSAQESTVQYLFGAADTAPPGASTPTGRATGRRSFASPGAGVPFGTASDLEEAQAAVATAHSEGKVPAAPEPPFKTDATARLPPRSSLPSAPPVACADADAGALQEALAIVARMNLPELRAALRARGLNPAGGLDTLASRLSEFLRGAPSDAPPFVPVSNGMEFPDKVPDAGGAPRTSMSKGKAKVIGSAGAGGGIDSVGALIG